MCAYSCSSDELIPDVYVLMSFLSDWFVVCPSFAAYFRRLTMGSVDYVLTGVLGIAFLVPLLLFSVYKFIQYLRYAYIFGHMWKKFFFHIFILCGILSDMPLYIMFIKDGDYNVTAYACHILRLCFLFSAFSLMIRLVFI